MTTSVRRHLIIGGLIVAAIIVGGGFFTDLQRLAFNTISVAVAAIGCTTFVVRYHFSTGGAWARSAVGRNIMLLMGCLAAALWFILSAYLFGDYPFRRSVGSALYPVIAYACWVRVVLQSRAQSALRAPRPDSELEQR